MASLSAYSVAHRISIAQKLPGSGICFIYDPEGKSVVIVLERKEDKVS